MKSLTVKSALVTTALLVFAAAPTQAQFGDLSDIGNLANDVLKPSSDCGRIGTMLGDLLGDKEAAQWSGIGSSAVCALVALDMKKQRKAAIKREKQLDKDIRKQRITNAELSEKNEELRQHIISLEKKAEDLRLEKITNPDKILETAAMIQAEKDAVEDRMEIVDERIESFNELINSPDTTPAERSTYISMRGNYQARKEILKRITRLKAS